MAQRDKSKTNGRHWLRIVLPVLVIVAWLAMAGVGGPYFGRVDEVSESDISAFLPESSEAAKVNDKASLFRDEETVPGIILFEARDGKKLSATQLTKIQAAIDELATVDGVSATSTELTTSEDGKAAYIALPIDSNGEADKTVERINTVLADRQVDGVEHWVTGAAGFIADLSVAFGGIDGILLLTALGVVFVILIVVYRSPLLPILVLLSALCALAVALFVVWWLAKWGILQLNGQVQGILFILVIGAATDYALLFVSRYREELYAHDDHRKALVTAWKGVLEPILASGGTVIVGLLCLIVSDLGSNKALGPVGAIGVGFAMLSALSFLPALLYVIGRVGFWPRTPHTDESSVAQHEKRLKNGIWHKVGDLVAARPRLLWLSTLVLLLAGMSGILQLKADGVPQSELIIGHSAARDGQTALNRHFPEGSGSPIMVWAPAGQRSAIVERLDDDGGIDGVGVSAQGVDAGFMPLGAQAASIKEEIRTEVEKELEAQKTALYAQADQIEQQAGMAAKQQFLVAALAQIPSVESLVEKAYPFKDATQTVVDDRILIMATLVDEPYSTEAQQTLRRVRNELHAIDSAILVGGTTAVTVDTNAASDHDRRVIIPLVLVAITIILMVLLRAILAPIVLLLTTVISFGAALGVGALLFNHVWHFPGADPTVVLYSFVFLVALGIDYNIFLMTRVREEALKVGTRKGVIRGLVVTGAVITSAGLVLAATFAALSVIPILFLVEIAFVVAFGVLLDTIIVRSLLVPAFIRDVGAVLWWPSKLRNKR